MRRLVLNRQMPLTTTFATTGRGNKTVAGLGVVTASAALLAGPCSLTGGLLAAAIMLVTAEGLFRKAARPVALPIHGQ